MELNKGEHLFTNTFFKEDFNVDNYVSEWIQKSDLLVLRNDLKNYGLELYTSMVEILKTETEGIVNLAENLTGLNARINDLYIPTSQLYEGIRSLCQAINATETNFKQYLDNMESLVNEKDYVNLKINMMITSNHINQVISSLEKNINMTSLERAVNDYSFQYLYLKEMGHYKIIEENEMENAATRLLSLVEGVFLKALKEKNEIVIERCLRMYVNLLKQSEAEDCVRKSVVEPVLQTIFVQKNLDDHAQNVQSLYDEAINFYLREINLLSIVLDRNPDLTGFDFLINSFWVEVDKKLRNSLPNITAPGNPELFQKRFKDTWKFLEEIARLSGDSNLFKRNPSFEAHMKRFNLPVYFEILFQQITAKFESELLIDLTQSNYEWNTLKATDELFKLKVSETLWNCVSQCFDDDVFLNHLIDQILKLVVLLLSRYIKWFESFLTKWKQGSVDCDSHQLEQVVIFALIDLKTLKSLMSTSKQDLDDCDTIFKVIPKNLRPTFNKILEVNNKLLNNLQEKLQQRLVDFLVEQSTKHLQQVTSIPRLYRRTNRNMPRNPSNYTSDTVSPLVHFHRKYNEIMGDEIVYILNTIITRLGYQYLTLVQEVLLSVCKTEESLRRLKSRNLNINDESVGQGDAITDEAKIREQIKQDVKYFVTELESFSLGTSKEVFRLLIAESSNVDTK